MIFSTKNILTKQNLLNKVTSYQIFKAYVKYFDQVGKPFKSEFRDEKSPSCMIEMIGGDLLYTDFAEGSYRALEFVMRKFNCSFKEALYIVNNDFGLKLIGSNEDFSPQHSPIMIPEKEDVSFKEKSTTIIDVHYKRFEDADLFYWNQYGWTEEMLKMASIRPIDYYWLTMIHKGMIKVPYASNRSLAYSYDYYMHEGIFRRKLYFPEKTGKEKWLSNVDNTIIQNWDLLPKSGGDILFITSSKKDCGPIYRLYGGLHESPYWNAIASNSESQFICEPVFYKLRRRFDKIILWLDSDDTGIKNMKKFSSIYNIPWMSNPLYCKCPKDQSDLWKDVGGNEFRRIMLREMNNLRLY